MTEIDLSSFLGHLGFGLQARRCCSLPSEAFRLSEGFLLVLSVHQHNGDFKLARLLKFSKISINVLSFSFRTSINELGVSLQSTPVCVVTQMSNFRDREKTVVVFPPLLAHACSARSLGEGEGYVLYSDSRHVAK